MHPACTVQPSDFDILVVPDTTLDVARIKHR
jgi:hypothetical protein